MLSQMSQMSQMLQSAHQPFDMATKPLVHGVFAFVGFSVAASFDSLAIGSISVYALSAFNRFSIQGALGVILGVMTIGKSHNSLTMARP